MGLDSSFEFDSLPSALPLLWVWAAAAVVMGLLWWVQHRSQDAGVVDVGWALALGCAAIGLAATGSGSPAQRLMIGAVGGAWGGRLGVYLLVDRILRATAEDGRYQAMRRHFGNAATWHFVWFFQLQAVLVALLAAPFWIAASNPSPVISAWQWGGLGLFALGLVGESVADRQLARFRRCSENTGRTCRDGLWAYSRHPNYFCEWLIWCGFAGIALPAPGGAVAVLAPVAMYFFVTKFTGIPFTEMQSIRSRGDDYRRYQTETNAFFPWIPRSPHVR